MDYRIEFIPAMLWALALAFAVGIPVVIAVVWLRYLPASTLVWLVAIVAVMLPLNVWFSRMAGRLLEATCLAASIKFPPFACA